MPFDGEKMWDESSVCFFQMVLFVVLETKIRECRRHLTVAYSTLCVNGGQSEKMIKIISCYNRK
jgi:hypothetical protein